jgi:hypothetical protein
MWSDNGGEPKSKPPRQALLSKCAIDDDSEDSSEKSERLRSRWCALGEGRWIERRCGLNRSLIAAQDRILRHDEAKDLNERTLSMLRHRQDHAIALLRLGAIPAIVMIVLRAVGMLVLVTGARFVSGRRLFEEMMNAVGRRKN